MTLGSANVELHNEFFVQAEGDKDDGGGQQNSPALTNVAESVPDTKQQDEKAGEICEYDGRVPANLPGSGKLDASDPRKKYADSPDALMGAFTRYVHCRTRIATKSKKAQLISTANEFVRGASHPYGKVGEPHGAKHIMLLGGFSMGTTESPERDVYIKRISRSAVKDKSQGYFKLTYNHLLEFEQWVLAGEPERVEEAEKKTENPASQAPKRQRTKEVSDEAVGIQKEYNDYAKRRSNGEKAETILRYNLTAPCNGDEDDQERPVIYLMRYTGTSNIVWYDRITDTFTSKTPIYAIGICLYGGRKRLERVQSLCGTGEWRLRHIADIAFEKMNFANSTIHEQLKNYGGLHSTPKHREQLGLAPQSADCFCFHGREQYEHAVAVINETCEALCAEKTA